MYAKRVDNNQKRIIEALRAAGRTVVDLSSAGRGVPDLLVGYAGRTFLVEVKNPARKNHKNKHTPAQLKFMDEWNGGNIFVIYSVEDALAIGEVDPPATKPAPN